MKKQTEQQKLIDLVNEKQRQITELEETNQASKKAIEHLILKNKKLKKKLTKALTWAELRNKQTGQLINSVEAISTKKTIGDAMGNIMNKITGGK